MPVALLEGMRSRRGQTSVEYVLVIAVVTVAVVASAWTYVPAFRGGVEALGRDVRAMLQTGRLERAPAIRLFAPRPALLPARPDSDCASGFVACPRCTAASCS